MLYKIESKSKGGIWDVKHKRLLEFTDGVLYTDNTELAEAMKKVKGFTVSEEETPKRKK